MMSKPVLSLLQNVEAISLCKDRARLPYALLRAVSTLLGEAADVGLFARDTHGNGGLVWWGAVQGGSGSAGRTFASTGWPVFFDELKNDGSLLAGRINGCNCAAVALQSSELASEQMILACAAGDDIAPHGDEILSLTHIYGNQMRLLDYSELDTLTRLFNRKTFDETFDRLLTAASLEPPEDGFMERRDHLDEGSPAWLCVIDIDHFKRVNDSFGHLFGDEVLLRMGELMRKTFRGGDRLFRFGGEEFVVILNAADETLAEFSFNRFRNRVEEHEFPQVGKVTCSIGFTNVSSTDVPTDVVGRADEALYFAKEHGRNQVRCYERLVAEGAILKPLAGEPSADDAFDIDALFG